MTITLQDLRADFEAKFNAFKTTYRFCSAGKEITSFRFEVEGWADRHFGSRRFAVFLDDDEPDMATGVFTGELPEDVWRAANVLHIAETENIDAAMLWKLAN